MVRFIFPAARGEKCGLRTIHLLRSEVVTRRAAREQPGAVPRPAGFPWGPEAGRQPRDLFPGAPVFGRMLDGDLLGGTLSGGTHTFKNQKLGSQRDRDSTAASFSPPGESKGKMAGVPHRPDTVLFLPPPASSCFSLHIALGIPPMASTQVTSSKKPSQMLPALSVNRLSRYLTTEFSLR